ncbi:phage shock protein C [Sphingomonas sp. F9_3S_D5_B_2]
MQDAAQTRYIPLPLRDHTILGVCEAMGEDFGFNPTFLRVPLAACVLFSVKYAIAAYLVLGVVVLASRLIFPNKKTIVVAAAPEGLQPAANADQAREREELQIAA